MFLRVFAASGRQILSGTFVGHQLGSVSKIFNKKEWKFLANNLFVAHHDFCWINGSSRAEKSLWWRAGGLIETNFERTGAHFFVIFLLVLQ